MVLREINELIERFETSDWTVLEYEQDGSRLRIEKEPPVARTFSPRSSKQEKARIAEEPIPESVESAQTNLDNGEQAEENVSFETVTSPIVGIFYQSSAPGAAPFVEAGSQVKKGDVLCIIEAMKVMNEIKSPYDGTIHRVAVSDGDMVDVGRTMFEVIPC